MSRIEELEKRLGADPSSRIFVQLAEEYRKAGLLEQAIEVCENGIKKHPQYPSARVALGRALLEAESFDRASTEFETVLEQVPDNILANKFLGETYERLGRLEEALQKYEIAHTLAPEDPDLEERINEVEKAIRAGGAGATPASAAPIEPSAFEEPPGASEELEPTMFDGPPSAAAPGAWSTASEPPPPLPAEPEAEPLGFGDDLAPIPLVDVDGPMELEDRFAAPRGETSAPPLPAPSEPAASEPPQVIEYEYEPEPQQQVAPPAVPPPLPEPPTATAPTPPPPTPAPQPQSSPLPPPAAPTPTPMPAAPPKNEEMETRTMAELYASQGHLEKAIEVYRKLFDKNPGTLEYRTRIDELTMLFQATQVTSQPRPTPPPPPPSGGVLDVDPGRDDPKAATETAAAPNPADPASIDPTDRKRVAALEGWLEAIRKSKEA